MLSAVALFLTGSVLPDAYSRFIDFSLSGSELKKLRGNVQGRIGHVVLPQSAFDAWLSHDANWDLVAAGPAQAREHLVDALVEKLRHAEPKMTVNDVVRERARLIVHATVESFIESLEPARATAVAESRLTDAVTATADQISRRMSEGFARLSAQMREAHRQLAETAQAAELISWPVRVGVPPQLADAFQPRQSLREVLLSAFQSGETAVIADAGSRVGVVTGDGGVGKSQLATYVWHETTHEGPSQGPVDVAVWVTASSRSAVLDAYANAAVGLRLASGEDPQRAAADFLSWLESTSRSWVVVMDDVADPADLTGLWPVTRPDGHGSVLITTRLRHPALFGHGRRRIDVSTFSRAESITYLRQRLSRAAALPGLTDELDELAEDLADLPLALAQASAYVLNNLTITVPRYRALLAKRTMDDVFVRDLGDEHQRVLSATWALAMDRAADLASESVVRALATIIAVLDPNGTPLDVLTSQAVLDHLDPGTNREDVIEALVGLDRYNVITFDPSHPISAVRMHALAQRATRERSADQTPAVIRVAADALLATWPGDVRATSKSQAWRAVTSHLRNLAGETLWQPVGHDLLFRAGTSLGEAGQASAAVAWWQQMDDESRQVLGPNHRDNLTTRNNLAYWRGQAGDAAGAAAAFQELLSDRERVQGPDHPDTLTVRGNLASWRGEAGDPAGAAAAFQDLLIDRLRVLGPDNPDTLTARGNLARWRGEAGDAAGAATATQDLLTDFLRVQGPDHLHTLTTRGNLARWRGQAGDATGAAAAFHELLTDCLRILGPDHRHTLTTRANLASWRGVAGDIAGAAAAAQDMLTHSLRVLGPEHPDTLTARGNLAHWRGEVGDAAGAAAAFEDLLTDRLRILGPDHPDTLATRNNLAYWRGEAGDALGAAATFQDLLTAIDRVLGPDHPQSLITRNNLAHWRGQAGDAAGAAAAFDDLLTDRLRILGPDHPHTLTTRANLASWRGEAGDSAGAVHALKDLLTDRLRILGPDHPQTLATRASLASWRGEAGDAAGAAIALQELLADCLRILSPDHPHTLHTRHELGHWRRAAGQ